MCLVETMSDVAHRTVVLFGRTGAGKSTCGNTLAADSVFEESNATASQTKAADVCNVDVEWNGKPYHLKIVDTIGIGDTDLTYEEVLRRLAETCYECRDGINAVFFVTGGRLINRRRGRCLGHLVASSL